MQKAIIGKKVGMTQIFDETGHVIPVTVIEAGPCTVTQKKTNEKDGYAAVQLGFEDVKEVITILRAVHKYKDSREQFERRTHKRLIDILNPNQKTVEALMALDLPAGVEIEIKL